MKKSGLTLLLTLVASLTWAQALLEDASGESTIYASETSFTWVRVNTSSASANLGFNILGLRKHGYDIKTIFGKQVDLNFAGGLDADVSVKDGIGKITQDGVLAPDFGLNLNLGLLKETDNAEYAFYVRGQLEYKSFDLAKTGSSDTLYFDEFTGWTQNLRFIFNYVTDIGTGDKVNHLFAGFSISVAPYSRFNNGDLNELTISTPVTTASNGQVLYENSSGLYGDLKRVKSNPVRADLAFLPHWTKRLIGFNTYYSTETFTRDHIHNLGMGVFFAKANNPKSIIGGITYQLNDLNNVRDSETKKAIERATLFFYVGFIFNSDPD